MCSLECSKSELVLNNAPIKTQIIFFHYQKILHILQQNVANEAK